MAIHLLDSKSIDKIAAGEVVERPASVVKELLENSIDAKATIITVAIKNGGKEYIRITDNGCGISPEDLPMAFVRHATSKIEDVSDLLYLNSLGFRGEALSSISAVSKTEILTRTKDELVGKRMYLEGGAIIENEDAGAPIGTSIVVRNLFYNTPARSKFLKSDSTEAGYIADIVEHLALSNPNISFTFIDGNNTKLYTSGNGKLLDVIINIYGREYKDSLLSLNVEENGVSISGYIGKPYVVRSSRAFETFFVNKRFIKSEVLFKATEEGYKEYLMQHKFPFCVLNIKIDSKDVDCNVHPQKMDVRFSNNDLISNILSENILKLLKSGEMIQKVSLEDKQPEKTIIAKESTYLPKDVYKFESTANYSSVNDFVMDFDEDSFEEETPKDEITESLNNSKVEEIFIEDIPENELLFEEDETINEQLNLFEEKILVKDNLPKFKMIGQVFKTYWMIEYEDKLLIVDQHAAHEKVNYERFMKKYTEKQIVSQNLFPAHIVTLSAKEAAAYNDNSAIFSSLGFEIEHFGGSEYKLIAVPTDLYGCDEKELFIEVLDDLIENPIKGGNRKIEEKIASMSCKSAVKGNNYLSEAEMSKLMEELLTLENPYNCPHGRPTMIEMTKMDMDKKFKRIV